MTADAASVSPLVIGNPGNGEVRFAGAGGGSPYAAFATGAIARGHGGAPTAGAERARCPWRAGRLCRCHCLPRRHPRRRRDLPERHRQGRRGPRAARRHRADGRPHVTSRIAPCRRGRPVHRHGRDGRCRREGGGGRHRHPSRGRPAQHAGAQGGAGCRTRGARQRSHRLRRRARHSRAARAHRAALSRRLQHRRRGRAGDRHDRLVGRISAGIPGELRRRRPGGAGGSRLSRLSQHPGRAQSRGRRSADLGGRSLPADRGGARESGADRRPDRGQPLQSHRHHGEPRRDDGAGRLVPSPRRAVDLRRDLSRHRL